MFESGAHRQGVQSITEITSSLPLARTSHCGACMCCIRVIIINLVIKEGKLFVQSDSFKILLERRSYCSGPPTVGSACAFCRNFDFYGRNILLDSSYVKITEGLHERLFIITLSIIMMIDSKAPLDRKDIVVDLRLHAAGCYHCHSDDNRGMPSLQPSLI